MDSSRRPGEWRVGDVVRVDERYERTDLGEGVVVDIDTFPDRRDARAVLVRFERGPAEGVWYSVSTLRPLRDLRGRPIETTEAVPRRPASSGTQELLPRKEHATKAATPAPSAERASLPSLDGGDLVAPPQPPFEAWWRSEEARLAQRRFVSGHWVGVHGLLRAAFEAGLQTGAASDPRPASSRPSLTCAWGCDAPAAALFERTEGRNAPIRTLLALCAECAARWRGRLVWSREGGGS